MTDPHDELERLARKAEAAEKLRREAEERGDRGAAQVYDDEIARIRERVRELTRLATIGD